MCLAATLPILTWGRASRHNRHPPCTVREVGRYQVDGLCLWGLAALPPTVAAPPQVGQVNRKCGGSLMSYRGRSSVGRVKVMPKTTSVS